MPLALASLSMLLLLLPVLPVTSIITITTIDNLHSSPIFLHRFGLCGAGWRARPCSAWRAWSWRACWPRSACTTSPWPPCSRSPTCPSPSSPPSAPPGPCPGSCSRELPMVVIVSTLCSTHTPQAVQLPLQPLRAGAAGGLAGHRAHLPRHLRARHPGQVRPGQ